VQEKGKNFGGKREKGGGPGVEILTFCWWGGVVY